MIIAQMTYHASYERADRLAFIAEYIGIGNIMYRFVDKQNPAHCNCITSTGVLVITSVDNNSIITAFCPKRDKMCAIFKGAGYARVPEHLMNRCYKNNQIIRKMGLTF